MPDPKPYFRFVLDLMMRNVKLSKLLRGSYLTPSSLRFVRRFILDPQPYIRFVPDLEMLKLKVAWRFMPDLQALPQVRARPGVVEQFTWRFMHDLKPFRRFVPDLVE